MLGSDVILNLASNTLHQQLVWPDPYTQNQERVCCHWHTLIVPNLFPLLHACRVWPRQYLTPAGKGLENLNCIVDLYTQGVFFMHVIEVLVI